MGECVRPSYAQFEYRVFASFDGEALLNLPAYDLLVTCSRPSNSALHSSCPVPPRWGLNVSVIASLVLSLAGASYVLVARCDKS